VNAPTEKIFNNRYRVDGLLGNGGMAIVYCGTDTLLRRRVAIKVLRDQYATDDDFVKRFSYEAQAAAKLSHPNIVNVYDFGREDSAYYIVMEIVDGSTLGELLRDDRVLPEPVAVDYAIQIASGLAYAHRQGLLHRDVKPANILVTQDDVVKLSDFGIARAVSEHTLGVTQPGMVMGSVAYISPEQAQGKELDERSDLYSVGVVLYQMLTGTLPFTGETPVAVALKHVSEPAPAISPKATGASPAIAAIVARLLRKNPEDRFASATELASALREARERPNLGQESEFSSAPTMRFDAVRAPQPPPRKSVAPDRRDAGTDAVEVVGRRGIERRWFLIPVLFLIAIAIGYAAVNGNLFAPPATIAVPDLGGRSAQQAQQQLLNLGLRPTVTTEASETVPQDRVVRQDPASGTKVAKNTNVALVVSEGKPRVAIPDVKGYSVADAQRSLANVKLRSKVVDVYSASVPAGQVIALNPNVGSSIAEDSTVALTVSKGAKPVVVPNLVGHSVGDAREVLRKRGLALTIAQQIENDSIPANMIASQNPDPDATVAPKSTVSVVVSTGAPSVAVPNVIGQDPQSAQAALQSAGFGVNLTYDVEPANAAQKVAAQNPAAGETAKKGSRVQIIVSVPGTVPDVAGMTLDAAKAAIVASGYKVGNIVYTQEPGTQDGVAVRTEPEANSTLTPGESVNITVNGTAP
jgi:serine/threonine-protein kinase